VIDAWFFERFLTSAEPHLVEDFGEDKARQVQRDARAWFEQTKREVPYIGGARNVFTPVLIVNVWIISLHRALLAHGSDAETTIRVTQHVVDGWVRRLPAIVLRAEGRMLLSQPTRWFLTRQAARSQARRYPADFVWSVENGRDGEVSLVFDECAVNKFYDAEELPELKPYCNFFDVTYSRLMNMGVDARKTIGLGCERCALRYQHGRETTVPVKLRSIISACTRPAVCVRLFGHMRQEIAYKRCASRFHDGTSTSHRIPGRSLSPVFPAEADWFSANELAGEARNIADVVRPLVSRRVGHRVAGDRTSHLLDRLVVVLDHPLA
jgi:hypothetical protein